MVRSRLLALLISSAQLMLWHLTESFDAFYRMRIGWNAEDASRHAAEGMLFGCARSGLFATMARQQMNERVRSAKAQTERDLWLLFGEIGLCRMKKSIPRKRKVGDGAVSTPSKSAGSEPLKIEPHPSPTVFNGSACNNQDDTHHAIAAVAVPICRKHLEELILSAGW